MQLFFNHLKDTPAFLKAAFSDHTVIAVIALVIFVLAVVMTNKIATFCRYIVVIGAIIGVTVGFVFKKYPYFWTSVGILLVLICVRLLLYSIRTIRQNRIDRRIEERALAKAASRRGSWKNRQGYSGHARAIEDDYVPGRMSRSEIKDVIDNELSDKPLTAEDVKLAREAAEKAVAAVAEQAAANAEPSAEAAEAVAEAAETAVETAKAAAEEAAGTEA